MFRSLFAFSLGKTKSKILLSTCYFNDLPKQRTGFRIHMKAVAVVRPEYRGEAELDIPGVREHGHGVGQGQLQLLGADGGELRPGEVTHEAPGVN